VVVVLVVAAALAGPQGFTMLFPARAEHLGGSDIPSRTTEEASSRLLPGVATGAEPSPDLYSFLQTDPGSHDPISYDPCRPIHLVVRLQGHSISAETVVLEAVVQVSQATGLKFVYDGLTDEAPTDRRAPFQPDRYGDRWAPVLVAWSNPAETPGLAGEVAGLGGSTPWSDTHGRLTYVTGTVWLDGPSLQPDTPDARHLAGVQAVVIHELGHVVGAGHVQDRQQIMAERGNASGSLGAGDRYVLAGWVRVGALPACEPCQHRSAPFTRPAIGNRTVPQYLRLPDALTPHSNWCSIGRWRQGCGKGVTRSPSWRR
jgi:hypothetical protein